MSRILIFSQASAKLKLNVVTRERERVGQPPDASNPLADCNATLGALPPLVTLRWQLVLLGAPSNHTSDVRHSRAQ